MLAVAVGAGTIITVAEAGKALVLVQLDVVKALRMDGFPEEAHAKKLVFQLAQRTAVHLVGWQAGEVALIAGDVITVAAAHQAR